MDHPTEASASWAELAAATLDRVRAKAPHVHVLTSTVAQSLSANVLLAAGAVPSLSAAPGEIEAFAQRTQALTVNLGMLDQARRGAIARALPIVRQRGIPWVLDPVKIDRSPERATFARHLVLQSPSVVRANSEEMSALRVDQAIVQARTGARDVVRLGRREVRIANGHPLMDKVTAIGCAGTTLIAAFLAVGADPFAAAIGALLVVAVAGEVAAAAAAGPGSFPAAFLDALYGLDPAKLAALAKVR